MMSRISNQSPQRYTSSPASSTQEPSLASDGNASEQEQGGVAVTSPDEASPSEPTSDSSEHDPSETDISSADENNVTPPLRPGTISGPALSQLSDERYRNNYSRIHGRYHAGSISGPSRAPYLEWRSRMPSSSPEPEGGESATARAARADIRNAAWALRHATTHEPIAGPSRTPNAELVSRMRSSSPEPGDSGRATARTERAASRNRAHTAYAGSQAATPNRYDAPTPGLFREASEATTMRLGREGPVTSRFVSDAPTSVLAYGGSATPDIGNRSSGSYRTLSPEASISLRNMAHDTVRVHSDGEESMDDDSDNTEEH